MNIVYCWRWLFFRHRSCYRFWWWDLRKINVLDNFVTCEAWFSCRFRGWSGGWRLRWWFWFQNMVEVDMMEYFARLWSWRRRRLCYRRLLLIVVCNGVMDIFDIGRWICRFKRLNFARRHERNERYTMLTINFIRCWWLGGYCFGYIWIIFLWRLEYKERCLVRGEWITRSCKERPGW